jgi:hypothetical protein
MSASSVAGAKQIQAKMALNLTKADKVCADKVLKIWENMATTTAQRDRTELFKGLEEYIDYRIIDTGAPCVILHRVPYHEL